MFSKKKKDSNQQPTVAVVKPAPPPTPKFPWTSAMIGFELKSFRACNYWAVVVACSDDELEVELLTRFCKLNDFFRDTAASRAASKWKAQCLAIALMRSVGFEAVTVHDSDVFIFENGSRQVRLRTTMTMTTRTMATTRATVRLRQMIQRQHRFEA
jgi:hypothetical protein